MNASRSLRLPALGVLTVLAAVPGLPRPLAAADPVKLTVFCAARPPDAAADEKTKKDQAEAPDAVKDIAVWLRVKDKSFTVVDSREAADLVIDVTARHVPGFGKRWITFDMTLGATPLGSRIVAAGGTWTQVTSSFVDALADWTAKTGPPIRAVLAARPAPASEADRAAVQQGLDRVGVRPAPPSKGGK